MIISLMVYGALVALLFGCAALATERALAVWNWPRRGLWALSLAISLMFPIAMMLVTHKSPETAPMVVPPSQFNEIAGSPPSMSADRTVTATTTPTTMVAVTQRRQLSSWPSLPEFDRFLKYTWIGLSVVLVTFYVFGWIALRRNARRWPVATVDGGAVRITESMGPAVLGYFVPEVVIPRWVLAAPSPIRSMMLMHEREHVAARDPLLLLAALLLMALVPWNVPLWWQLRRLRFALEVDCDARVLRRGAEARAYGEMLLSVVEHRGRIPYGAMALTEPISQLERRIRALVGGTYRRSKRVTIAVVGLSISLIAAAAELSAPTLMGTSELRKLPPKDMSQGAEWARDTARARFPEVLDRKFDGRAVISIVFNRDGSVVSAKKTLYAEGSTPMEFGRTFGRPSWIADIEGQDVFTNGSEDSWSTIGPWLDSKNPNRIDVMYTVLKWPIDPTRAAARAEAAAREHFPELFEGEMAHHNKIVTLFMNDDGSVNRAAKEAINPGWSSKINFDAIERFTALGLTADEIGRRGVILLRPPDDGMIAYAWPRRSDDRDLDERHREPKPRQDTTDDLAIISRYFADASNSVPKQHQSGWVLLGRDGHIWTTGRGFYYQSGLMLPAEIEARFPGIKVTQPWDNCLEAPAAEGAKLPISCVWLAPDSPVTKLTDVDFRQRPDVFIAVDQFLLPSISGGQPHTFTNPVYLRFGKPAVGGFMLKRLEITARDMGARGVELNLQLHSYYRPEVTLDDKTIQIRYDAEATIELLDDGDLPAMRLALRPQRVNF
jgi:beta-lactamase regulating signal transducer with metallopeptidase domain